MSNERVILIASIKMAKIDNAAAIDGFSVLFKCCICFAEYKPT